MAEALALVSASYLLYRAGLVVVRVRRARSAYPDPGIDVEVSERADRCRGAMVGHAIGDALNLPAESLPRWLVRMRYRGGPRMRRGVLRFVRRVGDVSDDTQLTIAVARSIDADGRYDGDRFARELAAWSRFRIGAGRATARAASGRRPSGRSEGNGVAIRVVPLAIAIEPVDELLRRIEENGRVTHGSEAAWRGAAFVAMLVREALRRERGALGTGAAMGKAIAVARDRSGFALPIDGPIETDEELARALERVGTSAHVVESVPAAALILLRNRLDVRSAMRAVFFAGGDTDSIGAVVGSVIGAQIGASALPADWARAVQHRRYLCWLADRLSRVTM